MLLHRFRLVCTALIGIASSASGMQISQRYLRVWLDMHLLAMRGGVRNVSLVCPLKSMAPNRKLALCRHSSCGMLAPKTGIRRRHDGK
jgi:hypothetical protein